MPKAEPQAEPASIEPPAKLSIYEALPLITADIGAVGKTNKNKDQGYAFRGIDDVVNGIHPLFAKYGISLIPKIVKHEQTEVQSAKGTRGWHTVIQMDYKLVARDGTSETASGIGESLAYDDKGTPKAQAMAFKYFLTQAFTIPTQENLDTEYDKTEDLAPRASRAPAPERGEESAHDARPASEGRSGPRPPRAAQAGQGLAGSSIGGLRRADSNDPPASDNDGAGFPSDATPLDQWQLEDLRAVVAVSGKALGAASDTQLKQIVSMGEEYVAFGKKTGKEDIARKAVEAAKLLLAAKAAPVDEDPLP